MNGIKVINPIKMNNMNDFELLYETPRFEVVELLSENPILIGSGIGGGGGTEGDEWG